MQHKLGDSIHPVIVNLIAGLLLFVLLIMPTQPASGGFSTKNYQGTKLTKEEYNTVERAISHVNYYTSKMSDAKKRWYYRGVVKNLEYMLKNGQINKEVKNKTIYGVCQRDNTSAPTNDKINLSSDMLTGACAGTNPQTGQEPESFNELCSTLVHEGVHSTQPADSTEVNQTGSSQKASQVNEYAAYTAEKYYLEHKGETGNNNYRNVTAKAEYYRKQVNSTSGNQDNAATHVRSNSGSKSDTLVAATSIQTSSTQSAFHTWSLSSLNSEGWTPYFDVVSYSSEGESLSRTEYDFNLDKPLHFEFGEDAAGIDYILVSGTRTGEGGVIRMMRDENGDGLPEPSTLITIDNASTFRVPRNLALTSDARLYVLDLGLNDGDPVYLYVLRDSNSDGVPDATPELVADEISCPALSTALSISLWEDAPQPVLTINSYADSTSSFPLSEEITILSNLDSARRKSQTSTVKMYEELYGMEPHPLHLAMLGDQSILAGGGYHNTLELHNVTSGQPVMLGTALVSTPTLTTEIFLPEGDTLQEGQIMELYDSTEDIEGVTFTVVASVPEVIGVTPTAAYAEDWVTLLGRNLPEEVDLYVGRWLVQTSSKTSTSIRFEMPYLHDDGMTVNFMQAVVLEPWSGDEVQGSVCIRYLGKRPGANAWPIADAGIPQYALPDDWVTLDGSASIDDDGDPLSYLWKDSAGKITIEDATQSIARFQAPQTLGEYFFTLTVSDGKRTDTDGVGVTIADVMPTETSTPTTTGTPTATSTMILPSSPTPTSTPVQLSPARLLQLLQLIHMDQYDVHQLLDVSRHWQVDTGP